MSQDLEGVDIDVDCDWDEEQIARAIETSQAIEDADPQAARQLRAQAQAARQKLYGSTRMPYDPMALYARVLRFYQGAITDERLEHMDYRRFLGYVREATLIAQEEKDAYNQPQNSVDAQMALRDVPHVQEYAGEVVRIR